MGEKQHKARQGGRGASEKHGWLAHIRRSAVALDQGVAKPLGLRRRLRAARLGVAGDRPHAHTPEISGLADMPAHQFRGCRGPALRAEGARSQERREGQERVSTWSSRWWPSNKN